MKTKEQKALLIVFLFGSVGMYNRVMCYSADRLTAELISREECITVFLERYMQSTYESERRDEYIKRLKDQKLTFTERPARLCIT